MKGVETEADRVTAFADGEQRTDRALGARAAKSAVHGWVAA
jgi:hypothetical protein